MDSRNFKFDIISFTKSWLDDNTKDLVSFRGYRAFHSLRPDNSYIGMSVFVKEKFTVNLIPSACVYLNTIECLGLSLHIGNCKISIITVYKPKASVAWQKCVEILSSVAVGGDSELYVCGEFNVDLLEYENNHDTQYFLTLAQPLSLLPVISKPTRITDTTETLIDHIYVNNPYNVCPVSWWITYQTT